MSNNNSPHVRANQTERPSLAPSRQVATGSAGPYLAWSSARIGVELAGLLDAEFPMAVVQLDADLNIERWSPAAESFFGVAEPEVLGKSPEHWPFLFPGEDVYAMTALRSLTAQSPRRQWIGNCVRDSGEPFHVQWFFVAVPEASGYVSGFFAFAGAPTDAKLLESLGQGATAAAHELTFEATTVGVAHVTTDAVIVRVNSALAEILGYGSPQEVEGKTVADITFVDDLAADEDLMRQVVADEIDRFRLEKRYVRKDGSLVWVNLTVSTRRDHNGKLLHFISVVEDIDSRKRMESDLAAATAESKAQADRAEQLAGLVGTDMLTNLKNRRGLIEWLEPASSGESGPLTLLFVDLDGFKQINDSYGHSVGDEVLRVCAERLAQSCRRNDLAARLGGDEFVIGLRSVGPQSREIVSERIRELIAEPIDVDGRRLRVSASIGVVERRAGESADELLARADSAMYRAKLAGGDRLALSDNRPAKQRPRLIVRSTVRA